MSTTGLVACYKKTLTTPKKNKLHLMEFVLAMNFCQPALYLYCMEV